ncbi:EpsG family protein [Helicobacter sp. 23-1045]
MVIFAHCIGGALRVFLAMMIILSASFLNGDAVPHSDFVHYFRVYNGMLENNFKFFGYFAGGIEVGLPIVYFVLGKIFGALSPAHFMSMQIAFSAMLFYIWLEIYGTKRLDSTQKAFCVALSLALFDFWFSALLCRQVLASIFILYAIFSTSTNAKWIFFIIAVSFHTSSLLFYPIIYLLYNRPKIGLFCCFIICLAFCFFSEITHFLWHLKLDIAFFKALQIKLSPYIITKSALDGASIGIRNLVFLLILLFGAIIYMKKPLKYLVIGLVLFYFSSVFVSAHFSIRIGVILMYIVLGYFLYFALRKLPFILLIFSLLVILNVAQTKSVFGDLTNTRIYYNYDIIGMPFYFLKGER